MLGGGGGGGDAAAPASPLASSARSDSSSGGGSSGGGGYREASLGVVHLRDALSPGTLTCLLHYLITDGLHSQLPPLDALALAQAAEVYGLPRLARLVESRLVREIDADNVCGLLDVCDAYGHEHVAAATAHTPAPALAAAADVEMAARVDGDGAAAADVNDGADADAEAGRAEGIAARAAARSAPIKRGAVGTGTWASLRAACVSFVLRNWATITASEDWAALAPASRAAVEAAWSGAEHAYRMS
jgi:hypothetical protein